MSLRGFFYWHDKSRIARFVHGEFAREVPYIWHFETDERFTCELVKRESYGEACAKAATDPCKIGAVGSIPTLSINEIPEASAMFKAGSNNKAMASDDRLLIRSTPYTYIGLNRCRAGGARGVLVTGWRVFREQYRKRHRLGVTVAQWKSKWLKSLGTGSTPVCCATLGLDWAKALVRHHTRPWVKRHQTVDLEGGELEVKFTVKPVARGRDGVSGVSLACPFRVSMLTQPLRATPCERPCNQADTGRLGQGTRFVACGEDTGGRHCRDPWPALSLIPSQARGGSTGFAFTCQFLKSVSRHSPSYSQ